MPAATSIFNHVLGPIMRGPSSSHTAGPYFIARLCRSLLAEEPAEVTFTFDPGGSFAEVYRQQGSDLGFAAGILEWELADERFPRVLESALDLGVEFRFAVDSLSGADHPNVVEIEMVGKSGRRLSVRAKSTGGGAVALDRLGEWPIASQGDAYDLFLLLDGGAVPAATSMVATQGAVASHVREGDREFMHVVSRSPWSIDLQDSLRALSDVHDLWATSPVCLVPIGEPIFASAAEMIDLAARRNVSLGQMGLGYEATLLGLPADELLSVALRRYHIMMSSVVRGLAEPQPLPKLLQPSAASVFAAQAGGGVAIGGPHARAAARALAVMHVNSAHGLICAAPTAGAAGVLPAVLMTLAEELELSEERVALALMAAGAIGLIVANRATFAAEVGGCQVEIGAAGAMAAAAVVEAAGGSPGQAADAAAISFQNTMGSVCDLVGGLVDIPCHTRNAVAASAAFLCADLVLGGYHNPIPLDETIDAVLSVGRMLPRELRCTALGGLANTPTAIAISAASVTKAA